MASEWEIAWAGAKSRDPDSSMLPSDPDELAALQVRKPPPPPPLREHWARM